MTELFRHTAALFKDFQTRQRIMAVLLALLVLSGVLYHAGSFLTKMREDTLANLSENAKKIAYVKELSAEAKNNRAREKRLTTSLLPHIQTLSLKVAAGQFTNIKLAGSSGTREQVTFRTENLVYSDFVNLLSELESYDNVRILGLTLTKRFDNPKRIDVNWEVVKAGD